MIAVGVDTHKHQHVAVALERLGQLLGEIAVAASAAGYRELVVWLAGLESRRWSGSKARAATAPGCASTCRPSGSAWWRSSVPAGGIVAQGKSDRDGRTAGGEAGAGWRRRLDAASGREPLRVECLVGRLSLMC